ncbi:MAG: FtsQ-type POTRA domain-containing protein [Acidobacteriia bacterium]|nr:FtsQ-type POTRA domain-containing protein [Terriglobia bacterium]
MARKFAPTISQEELYPPPDEPTRDDLDDARSLDLDVEQESPFLRAQKRVSVRRGTLPKRTATRLTWTAVAAVALVFCAIATSALYHYGEHSWRFRVDSGDDIEVTGVENVTRSQVMEVMGGDIGRNIFFIPLAQREAELERIPWVESASVMRFVPNRLRVDIHERTPVAFARVGSKILLVDSLGTLMDLPGPGKKKYSFPVILGINPGEPLSTRAARMKIHNEVMRQLDSGGTRYSQDLSEVDLSDPEDVKVLANNPGGEVLVHLGSSSYLDRYKIYVAHVQEWRQQFDKLESVDLRYDRQIVVNPDLRGTVKQPPLSLSVTKAAMAAGVKPAALITHEKIGPKPVPLVAAPANKTAKLVAKARKKRSKKPHSRSAGVPPAKPAVSATRSPGAIGATVKQASNTPSADLGPLPAAKTTAPAPRGALPKTNLPAPPKPASDAVKAAKKPSPAITKNNDQDHP